MEEELINPPEHTSSQRNNVDLPILTAYCSNPRFWVAGVFPTFMKAGSDVIMQKSARDVKSTKFESLAIQTMQWQKEK
jgi:hypothetical protein